MAEPLPPAGDGDRPAIRVHPTVLRAGAYAWRLLAVAGVVVAVLWLVGQLLVVVIPIAVAALLSRALIPVATRLRHLGLRPALAALLTMVGFLVLLGATIALVSVAVAGELDDLGPTLSEGIDDVTDWLVTDGPFDVTESDVRRWREQAGDAISSFVGSGQGSIVSGAVVAGEVVVGGLLALVVTFFFLKDGRRLRDAAIGAFATEHRPMAARAAKRAWDAVGGYLRGAALLGAVESVAIGTTLALVGSGLAVPVAVVTFLAAFVPIVGAIAAGGVAVLVALVTAGTVPALVVAAVALVVQQLDNELLAPVIYGKAVQLHPLVILLGIAAGGSLFGFVGTFFAVPTMAVALNVLDEVRARPREPDDPVSVAV